MPSINYHCHGKKLNLDNQFSTQCTCTRLFYGSNFPLLKTKAFSILGKLISQEENTN